MGARRGGRSIDVCPQAHQTRQNSGGGGVAEQRASQDLTKGGLQYLKKIYAIEISLFRVSTLSNLKRPTFKNFTQ